jgi:TM2 domain-containing membrane protein YozV
MSDMPSPVSDTNSQIQQAAQFIRNGDRNAAKRVVADLIKTTKDNADVWYLYAFLLDDPIKKRQAADRALAIDPEHTRTRQLVEKMQTDDLIGDLFSAPAAPPPIAAPAYQPPIIVNVNQDNHANINATAIANGGGKSTPTVNQLALFVGFVCALFGIFGIAHLMTGKLGGALGYFLVGLGWIAVAAFLISFSVGLGACIAFPLHFYFAFTWSKRGATS